MMGKRFSSVGAGRIASAGQKILTTILMLGMVLLGTMVPLTPVFADDPNCVDTSVIGEVGDDGNTQFCSDGSNGGLVIKLLTDIVDVLTVGVGILGVIGITVVGLQYLTAGGSEEKTRVAKRRMFEIVIGLVAYVAIYAVLKFLLPTFGT